MAGAFTHWMIVEKALSSLPDGKYATIVNEKINFVRIGSVGPDYPYLSELIGKFLKIHSWADRMHYEHTEDFVKNGVTKLLKPDLESDQFKIRFAWLCGYISHLLTDSIIHPVVNANVGGTYVFTVHDHVQCEMTQDAKIFYQTKGVDLSNAAYIQLLKDCSDPDDENRIHPDIRDFWRSILEETHPGGAAHFDKILPDDWHKAYISRLDEAAQPIPIFRHVGEQLELAYKTNKELNGSPEEKKYFLEIKLPDGSNGNFTEHAFNKTVGKLVEIWQKLFNDVENKNSTNCTTYINNWNLDTGLNEDAIVFWR